MDAVEVPRALLLSPGSAAVRVYVALADRCGEAGTCSPTTLELAREIGVGRRAVFAALKSLEADGWISRTRRWNPDGVLDSSVYRIMLL